jgi:hypothetical protein
MIYAEPEWLAGSMDFIAKDASGGLHIFDWKRSKGLYCAQLTLFSQLTGTPPAKVHYSCPDQHASRYPGRAIAC